MFCISFQMRTFFYLTALFKHSYLLGDGQVFDFDSEKTLLFV